MPRKKLTEYKAKEILFEKLGITHLGISVKEDNLLELELEEELRYVAKVDQGVKKRFKNGLIKIDVTKDEVKEFIQDNLEKGYHSFYIDRFVEHTSEQERYLSLSQVREGIEVMYSKKGGVDIEDNIDSLQKFVVNNDLSNVDEVLSQLDIPNRFFHSLIESFQNNFFSFLEINPLVINEDDIFILDLAVEVDSAAEFFVKTWSSIDFVEEKKDEIYDEVKEIDKLKENSTASFRLNVLNPDGNIFMLLSGGGASVVLADEIYNLGYSDMLGNYGEYSGNPNAEETEIYTRNVLSLLIKSKANKKALVIAGGVANFTDVHKTFMGVINALEKVKTTLLEQNIKVFVRRGGPNQKLGLENMRAFLRESGLLGNVSDPTLPLSDIVHLAVDYINQE